MLFSHIPDCFVFLHESVRETLLVMKFYSPNTDNNDLALFNSNVLDFINLKGLYVK